MNNATSYANGTGYVKDLSKPNRLAVQFGRGQTGDYDVYDTGKENLKLKKFFLKNAYIFETPERL